MTGGDGQRSNASGAPLHLVVHVPKCAGTTVESYIARTFPGRYLSPERRSAPIRFIQRPYYQLDLDGVDVDKIDFILGHHFGVSIADAFPGREFRTSVLLRDPLDQLLSLYNYRMQRYMAGGLRPIPFHLWYRGQPANSITEFLLHRYLELSFLQIRAMSQKTRFDVVCALLDSFWFVGHHYECVRLIEKLAGEYGVSAGFQSENLTATSLLHKSDLPSSVRDQILVDMELDRMVFDRFATRCAAPKVVADGRLRALLKDVQRPSAIVAYRMVRSATIRAAPKSSQWGERKLRWQTLKQVSVVLVSLILIVTYIIIPNDLINDNAPFGHVDDAVVSATTAFLASVLFLLA